jgi:hypothetical protein
MLTSSNGPGPASETEIFLTADSESDSRGHRDQSAVRGGPVNSVSVAGMIAERQPEGCQYAATQPAPGGLRLAAV